MGVHDEIMTPVEVRSGGRFVDHDVSGPANGLANRVDPCARGEGWFIGNVVNTRDELVGRGDRRDYVYGVFHKDARAAPVGSFGGELDLAAVCEHLARMFLDALLRVAGAVDHGE